MTTRRKEGSNCREETNDHTDHCAYCGTEWLAVDDCGFFELHPPGMDIGLTCWDCFDGLPGKTHQSKYGVGER